MDKQINFKVPQELWLAFRMALLQRGETAQAVLEKAVENYIKEGNEMGSYKVYVGEVGNEQGHFVGSSESLRGAKQIAGRELTSYDGDGWSRITNDTTGERYSREGNASWVGPF